MAENNNRRDVNITHTQHPQAQKKEWTVMIYLAGDNNLTANCVSVLQQLEAAKDNPSVCVLACFDSNTPWPKGSRYLRINCGDPAQTGLKWEIHNDLIPPEKRNHRFTPPSFCEEDSPFNGQPMRRPEVAEGLRRFVNWAMKENARSDRYMLILYGHGPVVAGQSFLARENPPSSLLLGDLKKILASYFNPEHKLDILACQNCVMNGIETAYEVRDQVKYMIGSQGLVLASGWPYEKILGEIAKDPTVPTEKIAAALMKACARNLLDFAVMDRSSEQSVCNVERIQSGRIPKSGHNIVTAVRQLVYAMRRGLAFQENKTLRFPEICDAIKLARLEAQSYWGEVFTDLYDFCERLLKKCNEAVKTQSKLLQAMGFNGDGSSQFKKTELLTIFRDIIASCIEVMKEIEGTRCKADGKVETQGIVEQSYFIGSDLQYSHGISIFFPWTLPTEPYFFTRSTNNEWVLRTAFETYCEYDFAQESQWSSFLGAYFKATLRKVRRSNRDFAMKQNGALEGGLEQGLVDEAIHAPQEVLAIDLQKSSSDTGRVDHDVWSTVKNYPRRNYLSPSDCARKIDKAGRHHCRTKSWEKEEEPPVSYLGWNITGIVAEVVGADAPSARATNSGKDNEAKAAAAAGNVAPATTAPAATAPATAAPATATPRGVDDAPAVNGAPVDGAAPVGGYPKSTPGPGV